MRSKVRLAERENFGISLGDVKNTVVHLVSRLAC